MIIQSNRVWIASQFVSAQIEIEGEIIKNIYDFGEKNVDVDYGNNRIIPGFIDIHCHGAYGFDTNDSNPEGLKKWAKNITREGVTAFLPTTITQSNEVLSKALNNVANVVEQGYEGAEIIGIHFEGPYLNKKYKGAQPEQFITKPSVDEFKEYQKIAKGMIKVITMACEHDIDFKLTKYASQNGVLVSIGHSSSTYNQAIMAVANGAQSMTHVFNAMSPYFHHSLGLVGAAMRFKNIYGEIVCDGNHSNLNAVNNLYMTKGREYVIMVTDALLAKDCEIGSHHMFGGNDIEIYSDGSAHLAKDKNFAGSTLRMNEGLKIVVEKALVPFDYALNSCTLNPAKALKIDDRKGIIRTGYDADLVVMNNEYEIVQTFARGVQSI